MRAVGATAIALATSIVVQNAVFAGVGAGGCLLLAAGAANLAIADGSTLLFVGLSGLVSWVVWLGATGARLMRASSRR